MTKPILIQLYPAEFHIIALARTKYSFLRTASKVAIICFILHEYADAIFGSEWENIEIEKSSN